VIVHKTLKQILMQLMWNVALCSTEASQGKARRAAALG
jgi:hypothetical protein